MPPPFRAEHVGSLLRPAALLDCAAAFARGEIDQSELTRAENARDRRGGRLQARLGLRLATDGEFRRRSYHSYFYAPARRRLARAAGGARCPGRPRRAAGRGDAQQASMDAADPCRRFYAACVAHQRSAEDHHSGPLRAAFPRRRRGGDRACLSRRRRVLGRHRRGVPEESRALAAAGCTYVQIDETAFAKFADPAVQASLAARGDDWRALIDRYIAVTNRVLRGMTASRIGMHLCRGNRGGHWHAEGSYEPVADKLFNALDIAFYFLEYDSPRAGDFAPLRLVPKHKIGRARPGLDQDAGHWRTRPRSRAGSRRRARYVDSIAWRSARSAASPAPRRAIRSRPPCRKPSCGWWSSSRRRSGAIRNQRSVVGNRKAVLRYV